MSIQLSVRNPQGKTETKVAELLGNTLYTNGYLFRLFSLLPLTGGNREKKNLFVASDGNWEVFKCHNSESREFKLSVIVILAIGKENQQTLILFCYFAYTYIV